MYANISLVMLIDSYEQLANELSISPIVFQYCHPAFLTFAHSLNHTHFSQSLTVYHFYFLVKGHLYQKLNLYCHFFLGGIVRE